MARKKQQSRGQKNIDWIEAYCRIPEGRFVGQPVKLRPWQKAEIRKIYDNPHGTRRAILSFGRKNAKTTLAGFLLLLHLCGPEAVQNGQLYSAAQSREQAAIIFALAAKIVRMSPDLNAVVLIRDNAKQLFCPELGTLYRALSADATTAYGLSPVLIIHDELAQVKGPRSPLYEALETAVGAQAEPLSIVISTQAPTDNDLLSILIDDALEGHDPRVIVSLYTADPDLDPFSEAAIRQANPAFGDFLNAKEVLAMAEDARRMPSREAEYRNLVLNQRVERSSPFISTAVWKSCAGAILDDLSGATIFAGLDLSEVNDLTAFVALADRGKKFHLRPYFWLPEDNLAERSRLDRVTYDLWAQQGYLETTPGNTIDYEFVADFLSDIFSGCDVKKIGFDRWHYKHLKPWLVHAGVPDELLEGDEALFEAFGQGYQSMSPALRQFEAWVLSGRIVHGNNPVMNMCATNAVVKSDPAGNRKLDKKRSRGRIDGMVAAAMAVGVASTFDGEEKTFDFIVI
jgi:phage terminase large subunit-like protein